MSSAPLGLAWGQAQAFTEAQKNEIRVVARLAADALSRAQQLEAERAARQRTERLQRMMTALVASASLDEVKASVFQHGLLPFGASAARLVLADQRQPGRLMTVNAVGLPEPALTEWREFPLSAHSPSRKALATGTIVYVPSRADLERDFPERTCLSPGRASGPGRRSRCAAAAATWACSRSSSPARTRWTRAVTSSP